MTHSIRNSLILVLAAAVLALSSAAGASPSNKWRIKFDGKAKTDGVIVFAVTPKGGERITVETAIEKGTRENAVAKAVTKSFKAKLPKGDYHVERDDWEDVLIKKKLGAERFDLELVSSTAEKLGIRLHRE